VYPASVPARERFRSWLERLVPCVGEISVIWLYVTRAVGSRLELFHPPTSLESVDPLQLSSAAAHAARARTCAIESF